MTKATLIVACSKANGIGLDGGLPWRLPKEMKYFAKVTSNAPAGQRNAVVMGRNTWESIPARFRPLKDRLNVVVSSRDLPEADGNTVKHAKSLQEALSSVNSDSFHHTFIIGGAKLYSAALEANLVDRILLTRILSPDFECDTFFPELSNEWRQNSFQELVDWTEIDAESVQEFVEEKATRWQYQMWTRRS